MQSLRGLRRAVPSTRPRYVFSHRQSRSFASSFKWWNARHLLEASSAEQLAILRQGSNNWAEAASRERKAHKSMETGNVTPENVDSSIVTSGPSALGDNSSPKAPMEGNQQLQDLCGAVTAVMAKLPHPAVVITTLERTYDAQAAAGVPIDQMRHPIARGITASSFTSLCIRPRPHVMFNVTLPSTMYDALVACNDFNVHVLTPDEFGASVASVFTRGNRAAPSTVRADKFPRYAFDIDADLGVFVGLKGEGLPHVEIGNRDAWHEQYQDAKESARRILGSSQGTESITQGPKAADRIRQAHCVPYLVSRGIMEVLNCRLVRAIHPELPGAGQNVIIIGEVVDVAFPKGRDERSNETTVALGYADRKYRSAGGFIHPLETSNSRKKGP
ncbi:flavin reductase like domain-containing protein [Xylaria intraflava]|nr:flavin reductase like domain-containing protein [Xylaria intraflava]